KRAPESQTIAALILLDPKGRTLLVKDPGAHDDVLFSRMWQFPAIEVSDRKRAPESQTIAALILLDPKGRTLLVKDPGAHDDVLFSRMWQFPAIEVSHQEKPELEKYFAESLKLQNLALEELPAARHGVTFR